jgi:AcrR family transcriptional regulator
VNDDRRGTPKASTNGAASRKRTAPTSTDCTSRSKLTKLTKGQTTRARLVDAAERELREGGGALEITAVAGRAGVSPALPYRYFASRSELLAAVVDRFFDRFEAQVFRPAFLEHGDWFAREAVRTRRYVDFFFDDPMATPVLALLAGDRLVRERQAARLDRLVRAAARNIARGQREGAIPKRHDAALLGALVMGGLTEALLRALGSGPPRAREKLADALVAFVERTLERPDARAVRERGRGRGRR